MFAEIKGGGGGSRKLGNGDSTKIADFLNYETQMRKYLERENITDVKKYVRHQDI